MALPSKILGIKLSNPDGSELLRVWKLCTKAPFGDRIFGKIVGTLIPYTGTIGARVLSLRPGEATVALDDRRRVRNHLGSIHAIAIANVGEFTTGLAMLTAAGPGMRTILKSLRVEYLKKARGTIIAKAKQPAITVSENTSVTVVAELSNAKGDIVARVEALWQVGPSS